MIAEITSRRIRLCLAKDVPDSGQEHPAYRDNSFLVTTTGFEPKIALSKLRMELRLSQIICDLDKKRLEINPGTRDPGGLDLFRTLIIARTATGPGDKVLG